MVLDLNIELQKTDEQKLAEIRQQLFGIVRMSAMQIKSNRDRARSIILENPEFTSEQINAFLGEEVSAQLAGIDIASSELLAKVAI